MRVTFDSFETMSELCENNTNNEENKTKMSVKKEYVCEICSKVFRSKKDNLTRHMKEQHSAEPFIDKFKCPMCQYLSRWRKNVTGHLKKDHNICPELKNYEIVKVANDSKCFFITAFLILML